MRIQKFDGSVERRIVSAMVMSTKVLARIADKYQRGMFQSTYSDTIANWCVRHFNKYGKAPRKRIQDIFEAQTKGQDDDTKLPLSDYLASLSEEYERNGAVENTEVVVDLAGKHFNEVAAARLASEINGHLDLGQSDKAIAAIDQFRQVEMGENVGGNPFTNPQLFQNVFVKERFEPLIEYEGALGIFFANQLCRNSFVGLVAPEGTGKCVSEDMEVTLADGGVITIGDIVKNKKDVEVLTFNESTQRFEKSIISDFYNNGAKQCWSVETKTGRVATTTKNHQYLTPDGWKYLEDIKEGDFIAVPKRTAFFGDKYIPEDELKFLAFMLADGGCSATQVTFTKTDPVLCSEFEGVCDRLGIGYTKKGIAYRLRNCGDLRRRYPTALWKVKSKNKTIPDEIFRCPREQITLFLKIFFSCDGYVYEREAGMQVGVGLSNQKMINQIGHLLTRLGIVYKVRYKNVKLNNKNFDSWCLTITDRENINLFLEEINFLSYKHRKPNYDFRPQSYLDKLPNQVARSFYNDLVAEYPHQTAFIKMFGVDKASFVREQINKGAPLMRGSFAHVDNTSGVYKRYMGSDILWDKVISIQSVGLRQTYDLTIPNHHNFIANNVVVHNSWMLLDMAYRAMLNRKRVAYFDVGDMTEDQIDERLIVRAAEKPIISDDNEWPTIISYPTEIGRNAEGQVAVLQSEGMEFHAPLTYEEAQESARIVQERRIKSKRDFFRRVSYSSGTASVRTIKSMMDRWSLDGFVPDVCIIDYADLLCPLNPKLDPLNGANETWMALRALSKDTHTLVITATQANRQGYGAKTLRMEHIGGDKRKLAHVTAMIMLNNTDDDRENQIIRLNYRKKRRGGFKGHSCIYVAQCLALAQPTVLSTF